MTMIASFHAIAM